MMATQKNMMQRESEITVLTAKLAVAKQNYYAAKWQTEFGKAYVEKLAVERNRLQRECGSMTATLDQLSEEYWRWNNGGIMTQAAQKIVEEATVVETRYDTTVDLDASEEITLEKEQPEKLPPITMIFPRKRLLKPADFKTPLTSHDDVWQPPKRCLFPVPTTVCLREQSVLPCTYCE